MNVRPGTYRRLQGPTCDGLIMTIALHFPRVSRSFRRVQHFLTLHERGSDMELRYQSWD